MKTKNLINKVLNKFYKSDFYLANQILMTLSLINRDKKEVSPAMQQWLHYPATMADKLTEPNQMVQDNIMVTGTSPGLIGN